MQRKYARASSCLYMHVGDVSSCLHVTCIKYHVSYYAWWYNAKCLMSWYDMKNGQPCFPLTTNKQWGEFEEREVKGYDSSALICPVSSSRFGCVLFCGMHIDSSVEEEYRGVVLCVWVAWRSTKIGISPPSPPATCLLALSSRPPSPTFKTPRKNIPGHHRNMHVTPSSRSLRSLLFNKIKTKNNWKIITPATRASDPSDTFLWADGWETTRVQHLGPAKQACI